MKMKKIITLFVIAAVVLSLTFSVSSHPVSQTGVVSGSESVGWVANESRHVNGPAGTTVYFRFHSGVSSDYRDIARAGAKLWNDTGIVFFQESSSLNDPVIYAIPDSSDKAVAWVYNFHPDSSGHFGSWNMNINTANIVEARDIAHEFGHVIGLVDLRSGTNIDKLMYYNTSNTATGPTARDKLGAQVIMGQHTNHSFTGYSSNGSSGHNASCTTCYGTATQGHAMSGVTDNGNGTHSNKCISCGYISTQGNHTPSASWTNNGDGRHRRTCSSNCGYLYYENHSYPANWSNHSSSEHRKTCTATGCAAYQSSGHTYPSNWSNHSSSEHRKTCTTSGCGNIEYQNHSYPSTWTYSSSYHSRTCTVSGCGNTEYAGHVNPSTWTNNSAANHKGTCATSGCTTTIYQSHSMFYDNLSSSLCMYRCRSCDYVPTGPGGHNWVNNKCTLCGRTR